MLNSGDYVTHIECETTAVETLSRYLHKPAMLDGEPVKMVIAVPVDFRQMQPVWVRRVER